MATPCLDLPMTAGDYEGTRRRLAEGSLLEAWRANPPPGVRLRSDGELESTRAEALRHHAPGDDLHVFGYGSLMWNPAMDAADVRRGCLHGWHRRFCLRLLIGRGCAEAPGVMLALDRGGACQGVLFRIAADKVEVESRLLWRREMLAGSYNARWVRVRAGGASLAALTFVANRGIDRYIGQQPMPTVVDLIRTGRGQLGSSREYFDATLLALERLGVRDRGIDRLRRAVLLADRQHA
ncbi:gamma-glutamylcyclotransferase [Ideonella sp. YS5]|uniref:gamma-glutamylcyclotransferase n=1 Tax=Ideonella sp. YS5 TaxID=3453714 RepID=UPI003EF04199